VLSIFFILCNKFSVSCFTLSVLWNDEKIASVWSIVKTGHFVTWWSCISVKQLYIFGTTAANERFIIYCYTKLCLSVNKSVSHVDAPFNHLKQSWYRWTAALFQLQKVILSILVFPNSPNMANGEWYWQNPKARSSHRQICWHFLFYIYTTCWWMCWMLLISCRRSYLQSFCISCGLNILQSLEQIFRRHRWLHFVVSFKLFYFMSRYIYLLHVSLKSR